MRNIRIFVEFASVVMPGGVLLLLLTALFAPREWLAGAFVTSASGIMAGIAFAFACGHLLQGLAQAVLEKILPAVRLQYSAELAVTRFIGREQKRYLTAGQIEQLELQYPIKLGIPFPVAADLKDRLGVESALSHAEAFLYSAKAAEHLDDIVADYKLNKGLFTAFLVVTVCLLPAVAGILPAHDLGVPLWLGVLAAALAATFAYFRMDFFGRKFAQSLFLQFLTTQPAREGGAGRDGGAAGAGAGVLPMAGLGRGAAAPRGAAPAPDDDN